MRTFMRLWSVLINPLFFPSLISLWYLGNYSYASPEKIKLSLYLIVVLTAAIPLLIYTILRVLKLADSIHLSKVKQRILPLIIYCLLLITLLQGVFNEGQHAPLYYFFIGVLLASIIATLLAIFGYKLSLHMMATGGLLGFIIVLALRLGLPVTYYLMGGVLIAGMTGTSRLYVKAHKPHEVLFGFCVGVVTQIVAASYSAAI